MRPVKPNLSGETDLFRARLDRIIAMRHELVRLAQTIDWDELDAFAAERFSTVGRPGVGTRFMMGLLLPKAIYGLSDEAVCDRWVENPYFPYFTGEAFFAHAFAHERSDLSHWRKRLGGKLDGLLAESLRVAEKVGAPKQSDLSRVTVDTTVQPKAATFPTDAKLLATAIAKLGELAKAQGVRLRQSYVRLAKRSAVGPVIGHMKTDGHLGRNFLKGRLGDRVNAVLSAVGYNFRRSVRCRYLDLKWLRLFVAILRQLWNSPRIAQTA
jgi:transposase, IS5 family